ncbi:LlaJI family restriction endonuclease [Helicobacter pylori]|uniref:LlaJI family restriction endonuclease n=1 Tax=Helicobacter pylori TaxID=210 RepID=UPI000D3C2FEF|nr:LlaJI family restriction endonuclease [Helicobacter pylori]PUD13437.1 LlaJI family restriction endonuclease [Helicobacter pylori]WRF22904.1 LlaJI family restriction endonuclease [Helicobacter pylori]
MFNLKERCFTDNKLNDNFVGIRNINNDLQICFPLGFDVGDDKNIRADIKKLISILLEYNKTIACENLLNNKKEIISSNFPLTAYKNVIEYFLSHGYYTENKSYYENNAKGKINFSKTIKNNRPIIQTFNNKNSFVYTRFQVKRKMINENELITAINKYCVHEAFSKFGFVFSSFMPPKFNLPTDKIYCIYLLENKLNNTFNDDKKILFQAMKNILLQDDNILDKTDFKFGTYHFYVVWERMIDRAFGVKNKEVYFPKTKWNLRCSNQNPDYLLQPDSIMLFDDKIYILDAKYYKYGISGVASDLPNSASIIKQIVYGEYAAKLETKKEVYNIFLMPFNRFNNPLKLGNIFENIGFANGEWRDNQNNYENIQGILIDTKFLMQNYNKKSNDLLKLLAKNVEETKNNF